MHLTRPDSSGHGRRFFRMEILPGLFGDFALVREWGRVGRPGQLRTDWFDSEAEAKDMRFDVQMTKSKIGYE